MAEKKKSSKRPGKKGAPTDDKQGAPTDDKQGAPSDDKQGAPTGHKLGAPTDRELIKVLRALLKKRKASAGSRLLFGPDEVKKLLPGRSDHDAKELLAAWHALLLELLQPTAIRYKDASTAGRPGKLADRWPRLQALQVALEKLEERGKQQEAQPKILTEDTLEKELELEPDESRKILEYLRDFARQLAVGVGEPYYRRQRQTNQTLKELIAEEVKDLIPAGVGVAISAGSTVEECLKVLAREGRYVRVMTNSLAIANNPSLAFVPGIEFSGGVFEPEVYAFVGDRAISAFKKAGFSYALVGVSGISGPDEGRLYVRHASELAVLWQMVTSAADGVIIVADAYKLGRTDEWHFSSLKQLLEDSSRNHLEVILVTNDPSVIPDKPDEKAKKAKKEAIAVHKGLQNLMKDHATRLKIVVA